MMADEKKEYQEEGEYHFSDDQVSYDIEPEASQTQTSQASPFTKETLLAKFSQHRKRIVGILSMFVLVTVVYKVLVPASTSPSTEFSQTTAGKAAKPAVVVVKTKTTTVSQPAPASPAKTQALALTAESKPVPATVPLQPNQLPVATVTIASSTALANPHGNTMSYPAGATGVPLNNQTGSVKAQSLPVSPAQQTMSPMNAATQNQTMDAQTKDRITMLEQQNTALMNLLQTEYAQKIADTETQTNAVRGKMEELTKRVNQMEASLNQVTQLLQGISRSGDTSGVAPGTRLNEPKISYSVQAIIPGRAWLKSESGDTVTVAEGDYLKRYGRVTKIDPYDGIVAIDTGKKIITLSYGLSGD